MFLCQLCRIIRLLVEGRGHKVNFIIPYGFDLKLQYMGIYLNILLKIWNIDQHDEALLTYVFFIIISRSIFNIFTPVRLIFQHHLKPSGRKLMISERTRLIGTFLGSHVREGFSVSDSVTCPHGTPR